jgi:GNAT superfamily N-acetyltransferase
MHDSDGPFDMIDLADGPPNPDILQAFTRLYDQTFTDPTEREDPLKWPERLWGLETLNPQTHLLVALSLREDERELLGGLMFEYYRESGCGLLSYLVVSPRHRHRGAARALVNRAQSILEQDAAAADRSLEAVFAETEDPVQVDAPGTSMDPNSRLAALSALGGRWIDIPYVQPELQEGVGRSRHLQLIAMTATDDGPKSIPGKVLRAFLDEYYRSLGISKPEEDIDFMTICRNIGPEVELKDLREKAAHDQ